jgi:hypothetical protein
MRRFSSPKPPSKDAPPSELPKSESERVLALTNELSELKAQLQLITEGAGFKCGTLWKYRPWAEGVFKVRLVSAFSAAHALSPPLRTLCPLSTL